MLTPNQWRPTDADMLELVDGPSEIVQDRVPSLDQADEGEPAATYPDYNKRNTRVVCCRIANDAYPGERFESRDDAHSAITKRFGKILEANYVPGRAFFRVLKVKP